MEERMQSFQCVNSHRIEMTPKVAIDCRFLRQHSQRGLNLTFLQLQQMLATNRQRQEPWPIFLTNFDTTDPQLLERSSKYFSLFLD